MSQETQQPVLTPEQRERVDAVQNFISGLDLKFVGDDGEAGIFILGGVCVGEGTSVTTHIHGSSKVFGHLLYNLAERDEGLKEVIMQVASIIATEALQKKLEDMETIKGLLNLVKNGKGEDKPFAQA